MARLYIDMNFQFQISEHHSLSKYVKQTVGRFYYSYILLFYQDMECCASNDLHDAS